MTPSFNMGSNGLKLCLMGSTKIDNPGKREELNKRKNSPALAAAPAPAPAAAPAPAPVTAPSPVIAQEAEVALAPPPPPAPPSPPPDTLRPEQAAVATPPPKLPPSPPPESLQAVPAEQAEADLPTQPEPQAAHATPIHKDAVRGSTRCVCVTFVEGGLGLGLREVLRARYTLSIENFTRRDGKIGQAEQHNRGVEESQQIVPGMVSARPFLFLQSAVARVCEFGCSQIPHSLHCGGHTRTSGPHSRQRTELGERPVP